MSGRRHSRFSGRQLQIDWNAVPPSAFTMDAPPSARSNVAAATPPVQRLQWDFRTSFPSPLTEAIDAGVIAPEDCEPENVRHIHAEHAREMLAVLHDLDVAMDIRRRGIDPQTGRMATTHAGRERLRKTAEEPPRLERSYANLLAVYEEAFGKKAAESFDKALRARHGGIGVVAGDRSSISSSSQPLTRTATTQVKRRSPRASLPVPRPLPAAITDAHFGIDDQGQPIRPSADEVREITTTHAEKLVELLDEVRAATSPLKEQCLKEYEAGITAYAESFGEGAARQLAAYVQRQAEPDCNRRRSGTGRPAINSSGAGR